MIGTGLRAYKWKVLISVLFGILDSARVVHRRDQGLICPNYSPQNSGITMSSVAKHTSIMPSPTRRKSPGM
jgi:hypothetical protein